MGSAEDDFVGKVCEQLKERATFVKDIWEEGKYLFSAPIIMMKKQFVKNGKEDTSNLLSEL